VQDWHKIKYASHRDSPYFMFTPSEVYTVWIVLDDIMYDELRPITYVKGSHLWNDGRVGSSENWIFCIVRQNDLNW
jgi:hypothetical protein